MRAYVRMMGLRRGLRSACNGAPCEHAIVGTLAEDSQAQGGARSAPRAALAARLVRLRWRPHSLKIAKDPPQVDTEGDNLGAAVHVVASEKQLHDTSPGNIQTSWHHSPRVNGGKRPGGGMVARRFLGQKTVLRTVLRYNAFGKNTSKRARPMWLVGEPGSMANMAQQAVNPPEELVR